jgi:hypothetical protein
MVVVATSLPTWLSFTSSSCSSPSEKRIFKYFYFHI